MDEISRRRAEQINGYITPNETYHPSTPNSFIQGNTKPDGSMRTTWRGHNTQLNNNANRLRNLNDDWDRNDCDDPGNSSGGSQSTQAAAEGMVGTRSNPTSVEVPAGDYVGPSTRDQEGDGRQLPPVPPMILPPPPGFHRRPGGGGSPMILMPQLQLV